MAAARDIRILPDAVTNQIAAGEVVERPASVVKELMENALDADAARVDVEVVAGGRRLVAVSDDGCGMSRDNALLSTERHATSKIRALADIEHIDTLGFRGEALAAIAAVSRVRVVTRAAGEVSGTEIALSGGRLQDVRDVGCPPGTRVEVRDLFFNVPARRKFLRSHQTELAHIRAAFVVQALAHPDCGFSLKVDGREAYGLPPAAGGSPGERLRDLLGPEFLKHLVPFDRRSGDLRVRGFVSRPGFNRADRSDQYLFVNGRATTAPVLGFAIREACHGLLPRDRHPAVVLFVELDPEQVDVNVHPTKREVRFRRSSAVRDAVIEAVREALGGAAGPRAGSDVPRPADALRRQTQLAIDDLPPTRAFQYPRLPVQNGEGAPPDAGRVRLTEQQQVGIGPDSDAAVAAGPPPPRVPPATPWSWCRVLGQVGGLYVVLETEDGLVLMDPHAAHERVLFERYMTAFMQGEVEQQGLLIPETVSLRPRDAAQVRKHLEMLRRMGFGISEFGGDAFVLDAFPAVLVAVNGEALLLEVLRGMEEAGERRGKGRWREESIIRSACRAAVKARDRLTLAEIEQLVVRLAQTEMPYTCPHGRPTIIFTPFAELARKFGRK